MLHAWAGTAAALLRVGSASGTEQLFSSPESSGLANPFLPRYRFNYMEPLSPAEAHRQDRSARRLRHREGSTEPLLHSTAVPLSRLLVLLLLLFFFLPYPHIYCSTLQEFGFITTVEIEILEAPKAFPYQLCSDTTEVIHCTQFN